ncbi:ATP-binding protein [Mucilaginibacter myungsuensis]|uniref:histidine kinase n=1 Tax=Mucilaginibacter myungsuensis TaxID=649104 RepID=A0A929L3Z9_9SPHI|nr:ATP-binding protein [Mucilaginibacter myungsuensis]MBE9662806.1 GAF domain-containing protein [Mucilaginibacter myungsuensis]MDN3598226.1 ATP-binding protein [Mucilaginibacter myungsuensis]
MTNYQVDLTNCDREPIHIPGKVQSHGFLVAVEATTLNITYISQNIADFIKDNAQNWLGKNINDLQKILLPGLSAQQLNQLINLGIGSKNFESINPYNLELNGDPYFLILTQSDGNIILEFEPTDSDLDVDVQRSIGRSVSEILTGKNLNAILTNAAREIKKIIQYDRVMIYRFNEDEHGEVVAEVKNDDLEPFMGLHYPASDIPKQARQLYKLNLTRIIADVNTDASPIVTFEQGQPLDLTHSVLRAVSPIHIQYLKNMGVASSFSISLIAHGELWGLVACHNYTPRFINFKAREAAKLVGQILSSALEYRQDEEDTEQLVALNSAANEISARLKSDKSTSGSTIVAALTKGDVNVADITNGSGAAVIIDGVLSVLGHTPTGEQIIEIAGWLKANMADSIYYTHRFPEVFSPAKAYSATASGILACALSKDLSEMIIWFKPETITTISWAGNPEKPAEPGENGIMQLSPRNSFETWEQIVKNTSARWTNEEVSTVLKIREEVIYAINRRANEIRLLNERLQLAYEELDTFSYTISHDLRTPLSSVKSYSEFLLATNKSLDDKAKEILNKIVAGADKMNMLIKEILNYSRVGRAEIEFNKIDMTALIGEVAKEVTNAVKSDNLQLTIGDTPNIYGDQTMIMQVFTNLINNAVKYSSRSNPSIVEVKGRVEDQETIYSISDNGVGIDVNYFSRVFELFKRMDNAKDYEGTGVGLAIVKRIVEKHHARIWFESKLGSGTVFYISFRNY